MRWAVVPMSVGSSSVRVSFDAAVGDQLLEIGEGGLGGELGFLAAGGAQQRDHVAEFVEGVHAQGADRAGRVAGIGFLGGDLECSGLHGDEADLVGDDVVHLPGQLGAFVAKYGLKAPATWDDFIAAGEKLKKHGVYVTNYADEDPSTLEVLAMQAGAPLVRHRRRLLEGRLEMRRRRRPGRTRAAASRW